MDQSELEISAGMDAIKVQTAYQDLPKLTRQEAEFAATLAATSVVATASKRAGISPDTGSRWAKNPSIAAHVEAICAKHQAVLYQEVSYSLADAHADIEMGKRMAANASEWFKGVELHMRLHGLDAKKAEVNVNVNHIETRQQLENLDDDAILEMAGFSYEDLLPQAVEGEIIDEETSSD